jgi:hypothetical protein
MNINKIKQYLALFIFLIPNFCLAHSFGTIYTLPIPVEIYFWSSGIVIFMSFILIGLLTNKDSKVIISDFRIKNFQFLEKYKYLSLAVFLIAILLGLFGPKTANANFAMNYFWIYFVLVNTYLSFFLGNYFPILNPFKIITEKINKHIYRYPISLGYLPALFFYFVFIWLELIGHLSPYSLSTHLLTYLFINVLGVKLIGKEDWFKYCEFFSLFFRLASENFLKASTNFLSLLVFIIFMLSSTAFDGFKETDYWTYINLIYFSDWNIKIFQTFGLVFSLLLFLFLYFATIIISKILVKTSLTLKELSLKFAFSLIPIAIAYNIAHYFTLILTEGPNIFWTIFKSENLKFVIVPDSAYVWNFQIFVIVVGHLAGVYLSHKIAIEIFEDKRKATLNQVPFIFLMIVYTIIGLWILSQPFA